MPLGDTLLRDRVNWQSGVLDSTVDSVATGLSSTQFASLPDVVSPNHLVLVLDKDMEFDPDPEIVWVTSHVAGASTVIVVRGREGTVARTHTAGTKWVHGLTAFDMDDTAALIEGNVALIEDTRLTYLSLSGGIMSGDIDMGGFVVHNIKDVDEEDNEDALTDHSIAIGESDVLLNGFATILSVRSNQVRSFQLAVSKNGGRLYTRGLDGNGPEFAPWNEYPDKGYVDGTFLPLGGGTMEGHLLMGGNRIAHVGDPNSGDDAMPRSYADARYIGDDGVYDDAAAVAAMGATSDSNDLNHNRYTDAEARAAVSTPDTNVATGGAQTKSPGGTVSGTSWALVHTFTINPPNSWGTARIVCRAVWHGAGVTGGNMQMQAHLNIDGVAGVDVLSGVAVTGDDPTLSFVQQVDTATDPIEVKIFVRDTMANGGSVTNRYVDIDYAMYRVS